MENVFWPLQLVPCSGNLQFQYHDKLSRLSFPRYLLRIWETRTWSAENWNVMEGHVQAVVWSPCGSKVIFADSVQPTLYCLSVDPLAPLGEKPPPALKALICQQFQNK